MCFPLLYETVHFAEIPIFIFGQVQVTRTPSCTPSSS